MLPESAFLNVDNVDKIPSDAITPWKSFNVFSNISLPSCFFYSFISFNNFGWVVLFAARIDSGSPL